MLNKGKLWEAAGIILLLLLYFFLAFSSIKEKSATFDEGAHITGGYSYWKTNSFFINPESGLLTQKLSAFPLIFRKINYPDFPPKASQIGRTALFMYKCGNDPDRMISEGRMMIIITGALLGLFIFMWSRSLFGSKGALFALALYILSPNIMAHCRLVTADIMATAGFLFSLWAVWRLFFRVKIRNILLVSLAVSFLMLSKFSSVLIIPCIMILLLIRVLIKKKVYLCIYSCRKRFSGICAKFVVLLASLFISAVFVFIIIWGAYGFRFSMSSDISERVFLENGWKGALSDSGSMKPVIETAKKYRVLPEAYLYGFAYTYASTRSREAFLMGKRASSGWWYFFPVAFFLKVPVPLIIIFCYYKWIFQLY